MAMKPLPRCLRGEGDSGHTNHFGISAPFQKLKERRIVVYTQICISLFCVFFLVSWFALVLFCFLSWCVLKPKLAKYILCVAKMTLNTLLLSPLPKCWNCRSAAPHPVFCSGGNQISGLPSCWAITLPTKLHSTTSRHS